MKIINLTHRLENGMYKYPSDPEPKINIVSARLELKQKEIYDENGTLASYEIKKYKSGYSELSIRNHHGTHLDAPAHKLPDGKKIGDYKTERFINRAVIINLTKSNILSRSDKEVRVNDIAQNIPNTNDFNALIIYTGFCDLMQNNNLYKKELEESFPYLKPIVAKYLSTNYEKLSLIGIDSFSVDKRGSNSESHRELFKKDILILETLVNLSELNKEAAGKPFQLVSVPVFPSDMDASPTAAYAIIN
ncbi:MAG TPA: cyclase family protein [Candidatus Paceibacterota bacterium]|nr:cyclase family protein [Candidatus Paceibacterota bacterium]